MSWTSMSWRPSSTEGGGVAQAQLARQGMCLTGVPFDLLAT
jgi:hypothetical protein